MIYWMKVCNFSPILPTPVSLEDLPGVFLRELWYENCRLKN